MRFKKRRGAAPAVLSMLIFIGSIISLLALVGTSYNAQAGSSIGAGSEIVNNQQNGQVSVSSSNSGTGPSCQQVKGPYGTTRDIGNCQQAAGSVLQFLSTPLGTSIAIAVVFVGLGILAGLMGAGILANLVAGVGLTLALVNYITGTINNLFGSVPGPVIGIVIAIITATSIYMIADMLSGKF